MPTVLLDFGSKVRVSASQALPYIGQRSGPLVGLTAGARVRSGMRRLCKCDLSLARVDSCTVVV